MVDRLFAPTLVQQVLVDLLNQNCETLEETNEAIELAQKYIQNKILPEKFEDDARHVAIATIYNIDIIASWNFKHIVHFDKIRQFNSINLTQGYKSIEIFSPREVVLYED